MSHNSNYWQRFVKVLLISLFSSWVCCLSAAKAQTTGSITGKVLAAGPPVTALAGVTVAVCPIDDLNKYLAFASTDANGVYTLTGLAAGSYKVKFFTTGINYIGGWYKQNASPPASAVAAFADGNIITLTSTTGSNLGETQLDPGLTITGNVTDVSGGAYVAGIYVQAYKNGIWEKTSDAVTDSTSGTYIISGLRAGNYTLRFWAYETSYTTEWYSSISLLTNTVLDAKNATPVTAGSSNINAKLSTGGRISGTVYDKTGAVPIVGALVFVYDSASPYTPRGFATTLGTAGLKGTYTVQGLPVTGSYIVQFYEKDINNTGTGLTEWYKDASLIGNATPLIFSVSSTIEGINANLDRGPISGKVTDSAGLPLSGVSVTVYDSSKQTVTSVVTDAQGQYSTGELQAGDYKVQFSPLSWYANKTNFTEATSVPAGSSGVNGIFKPFNFAHVYNVLLLKKRCLDANGTPMHCNCFEANGTPAYCSDK